MNEVAGLSNKQLRDELTDLYRQLNARLGNRPQLETRIAVVEVELSARLGHILEDHR